MGRRTGQVIGALATLAVVAILFIWAVMPASSWMWEHRPGQSSEQVADNGTSTDEADTQAANAAASATAEAEAQAEADATATANAAASATAYANDMATVQANLAAQATAQAEQNKLFAETLATIQEALTNGVGNGTTTDDGDNGERTDEGTDNDRVTTSDDDLPDEGVGDDPSAGNPVGWGPAGEAPQSAEAASTELGISVEYLTPHNNTPGGLEVGWVIGDPPYNATVSATLADGFCVDYDPDHTEIDATAYWVMAYDEDWHRAYISSSGTIRTNKATIYWSKCYQRDGRLIDLEESVDNAGTTDQSSGSPEGCITGQQLAEEKGWTIVDLSTDVTTKYKGAVVKIPAGTTLPDGWEYIGDPGVTPETGGTISLYPPKHCQ